MNSAISALAVCVRAASGIGVETSADRLAMFNPATHQTIAAWLLKQTRKSLDKLAVDKDIPLHTLSK